jgi:tRNA-specific 2-thiouridylase
MKNWHDDSVTISNECPWLEDSNDALLVAKRNSFQTVDLVKNTKRKSLTICLANMKRAYSNPDVLCNREIKFEVL